MEPTEESDGVLLRLLQSGKFSDLQLSCQGRNFDVHKNIVCEQSPVINAACQGSFEESRTNVIKIEEFNADAVYTMLEFLYRGNYTVPPDTDPDMHRDEMELPDITQGRFRPHFMNPELDADPELGFDFDEQGLGANEPTRRKRLYWHLHANAIGDYYDVQGLCELARSKVKEEFEDNWSSEGFFYLLMETCPTRKTGDAEFYRLLGHLAAENQGDLVQLQDQGELDMPAAFFMSFISSSIERVRVLEGRKREPVQSKSKPYRLPRSRRW